jgi:hypothetical protein
MVHPSALRTPSLNRGGIPDQSPSWALAQLDSAELPYDPSDILKVP